MSKILVLGSTGMLGHKMIEIIRQYHLNVSALSRQDGLDAEDLDGVRRLVGRVNPDVIVNCVGIIKQRYQIKDRSTVVNGMLPDVLASIGRVIHFSSDCVFDGMKGNYTEADKPDAQDIYGRTKALGELCPANVLVLRSSIIGREKYNFHGLLEWFLRQDHDVPGYSNTFFSGVTTNWMAQTVAELIYYPDMSGLYNVASSRISKYDLLKTFKDVYNKKINIIPVGTPASDRSLDSSKFVKQTGIPVPDLQILVRIQRQQDEDPRSW